MTGAQSDVDVNIQPDRAAKHGCRFLVVCACVYRREEDGGKTVKTSGFSFEMGFGSLAWASLA